jgi:transcriptional regulator with XRE-family HTH domain
MSPDALLREARQEADLTQAELAGRLGITQAAVARLERPGTNPTFRTLERALQATGQRLELRSSARPSSVDETLVASYLRLSPAERLRAFQSSHASVQRLRDLARETGNGNRT